METFDDLPHAPEQEGLSHPVRPEEAAAHTEPVSEAPGPEFLDPEQVFIRRGPAPEPQTAPEAPRSAEPEDDFVFRPTPRPEPYRSAPQSEPYRSAPQSEPYRYVPQSEPYRYVPQSEPYRSAPQSEPVRQQSAPEAPVREPRRSPYADSPYVCQPRQQETVHYVPPKTKPGKESRKKSGFWRGALAVLLTVVLVAAGCGITAYMVDSRWQQQDAATAQQLLALQQRIEELEQRPQSTVTVPSGPVSSGEGFTPAQVYSMNADSVVAVNVTVQDYFYGEGTSAGSGFILTEDGYVVTNYHVVEGAMAVSITLRGGDTLDARVVGYDATNDVAVLKVEAQGLPTVTLGSSTAMNVGDMVVAIGNPLGELNSTQTVGFICGKDREITTGGTIINMLQTDAAINPGNSGGPLFNMAGQVIGITTAKYSGTTSSGASIEGIGFAIPIDDVMGIIGDLKTYGYVTGAYLGITVQNVDPSVSDIYGISGAYVIGIEPGYAADRAGLEVKDLIVALNGQEIGSITDLTRALRNYKAGDTVTLTVIRGGVQMDLQVTLDEKPQDLAQPAPDDQEEPPEGDYDEWYDYFFGDGE